MSLEAVTVEEKRQQEPEEAPITVYRAILDCARFVAAALLVSQLLILSLFLLGSGDNSSFSFCACPHQRRPTQCMPPDAFGFLPTYLMGAALNVFALHTVLLPYWRFGWCFLLVILGTVGVAVLTVWKLGSQVCRGGVLSSSNGRGVQYCQDHNFICRGVWV